MIFENTTEYKKLTTTEKAVYKKAIDCLLYGYTFQDLNYYDLTEKRAKQIWKMAFNFLFLEGF